MGEESIFYDKPAIIEVLFSGRGGFVDVLDFEKQQCAISSSLNKGNVYFFPDLWLSQLRG